MMLDANLVGELAGRLPSDIHLRWTTEFDGAWLPHTEELRETTNMTPARAEEFLTGRQCAHRALLSLGISGHVLTRLDNRAPQWPDAVVGSISHTDGLCIAVAASAARYPGLGVDVERLGRVRTELWPTLFGSTEVKWLSARTKETLNIASTLLFSAKEAYFKFQFPRWRYWLEFVEVEVTIVSASRFVVAPTMSNCPVPPGAGAYSAGPSGVATCVFETCGPQCPNCAASP